jgi:glutamate carboxypeptidase
MMTPPPPEVYVPTLQTWIVGQRESMLADLRTYVELESPSDDLHALADALGWIESWVVSRLGEPMSCQRVDGGAYGSTTVMNWPGTGHPVALLAHYDTVWPLGTLAELPFALDGDIITGPGVFDMKAGLVQAVWSLRALDEFDLPRPPVRLLLNGDEEVGSPSSRPTIESTCADAAAVLVFEPSSNGALKTARKGVGFFDIEVRGVAAHAGLDPTLGASAITALAHLTLDLASLTDLVAGTSVNVGTVAGGTRKNVTAGEAAAGVDVRVPDPTEAARIDRALARLDPHEDRVTVAVSGGWNRPPMPRSEGTEALFNRARALAAHININLQETSVGGASDGNFAAALGRPVLDGLGALGAGAHARTEHATISGMVDRAALSAAILTSLASDAFSDSQEGVAEVVPESR